MATKLYLKRHTLCPPNISSKLKASEMLEAGPLNFVGNVEANELLDSRVEVVVCDGEERENEGDVVLAAQFATPETVNFMTKEARGLVCLALTPERCEELGLDLVLGGHGLVRRTNASRVRIIYRQGNSASGHGLLHCRALHNRRILDQR